MKIEEYKENLQKQGIPDDAIEKQMAIIGDFINFLTDLGLKETTAAAGKEEVERFARKLIAEGRNTLENFSFLCDYTNWLGHRRLYVALVEVMDCHNALEVLADEIKKGTVGRCVTKYLVKHCHRWEPTKRRDVPMLERLWKEWRNRSLQKRRAMPGFRFSMGFLPTFGVGMTWRIRRSIGNVGV